MSVEVGRSKEPSCRSLGPLSVPLVYFVVALILIRSGTFPEEGIAIVVVGVGIVVVGVLSVGWNHVEWLVRLFVRWSRKLFVS